MADQSGSRKILLALNEDGLGPLTFGFHIARGILQNDSKTRLTIRRNTRMDEFEELLRTYSKAEKWAGEFSLDPVDNLIRVKKKDKSQVDLETTMKRLMLYPKQRLSYPPPPSDDPYDLVIDFGVPTLAHLSAESSVPHVTVFDHSWGFTFLQMAREYNKKYIKPRLRGKLSIPRLKKILEPTPLIRTAIEAIIADESRTNAVYLFPFYLTLDDQVFFC